ncbi:glucose-1-phosphate cytidylyltransferase [Neobacillus sp. Marseille-QA0830]
MKVVILAGGFGTRISEESHLIPKPMIEIGTKPILWHIMKIYAKYGFNEFVICLGYKGKAIKDYFLNYFLYHSDLTVDYQQGNQMQIHSHDAEPWKITLIDTGLETMTGGRIKRIRDYVDNNTFMLTYGDGVADIDITELLNFHKSHQKIATVTAVQPPGRFGALTINDNHEVGSFKEKMIGDGRWINGGFFVLEPEVFNYIEGDHTVFEEQPLMQLAEQNQLMAYKHTGFWHPMDTLKDKKYLESLWGSGKAGWKIWDE